MRAERAARSDLPSVANVLASAREYLVRQGLDQWQNFPPTAAETEQFRERGELYVMREGGEVAGTFVLVPYEPCYETIDGAWRHEGAYFAIHRVAVSPAFRRRGVASAIFSEAARLAKGAGAIALRIDTHADNVPMRAALEKNAFVFCGTVVIATGERRVAYEKELT